LAFDRFVDIWLENTVRPVQHSIHGMCSRAHIS
jgi:hypothetical protein